MAPLKRRWYVPWGPAYQKLDIGWTFPEKS